MICLIDGNNFFVSCERVFNPKLQNVPVLVLSGNDGIVISRSNEAKALGIKMGQPFFELKNFVEQNSVQVFSSNFVLYGDMSERMMNVISEFLPVVEVYSIDEAFCDLSFVSKGIKDSKDTGELTKFGWEIKNRVKKCTGIPCGIGISYTKVLAKIANDISKKSAKANGVLALVEDKHIDYALSITEVEGVWGIGRQSAKSLRKAGIKTAKDFRDADEKLIQNMTSIVGLRIQKELRKESCIDVKVFSEPRKSLIFSRSFSKYITNFDDLLAPLLTFVSSACAKLRKEKMESMQIGVVLQTNPFAKQKMQYSGYKVVTLPFYTSSDFHIARAAIEGLKSIYKEGFEYKKCGVTLLALKPESNLPSNLFDTRDIGKERELFNKIDSINQKFGLKSICLADTLDSSWQSVSILKSKEYTTNLNELMLVE